MDRGQLRYGNEKLVPFAYCENAISGKRYVHVITVLIKRGVAPTMVTSSALRDGRARR